MIDGDKRLHELNTAWGRGYVFGLFHGRDNPPWAAGATGDQWGHGFYQAGFDVVFHGAQDERA